MRLCQEDLDRQTRDYLKKNLGEATTFIHAIDERQRTIERIAVVLLALQGKFFETGRPEDLRPLNLDRVADRLGLAGSTISRAIAGKFMWTPWGIRSFKSFFSSGYRSQSGEEVSSLKVRMRIKEIIGGEDSKHPVSDQEISDRLKKEGFTVKRRTVAKYRELDGIPTSSSGESTDELPGWHRPHWVGGPRRTQMRVFDKFRGTVQGWTPRGRGRDGCGREARQASLSRTWA